MKRTLKTLVFLVLLCCMTPAHAESDYCIDVDITSQIVAVYRYESGIKRELVRLMICSTGIHETTPLGTFEIFHRYEGERAPWYYILKYDCYVHYPTRIHNDILFHSIPYKEKSWLALDKEAEAQLGSPASHGCVRLRVADALWIARNCPDGTTVTVFESGHTFDSLREILLGRTLSY